MQMSPACAKAHILYMVQVVIAVQIIPSHHLVSASICCFCNSTPASQVFTHLCLMNPRAGGGRGGKREETVGVASPRRQAGRTS